MTEKTVAVEKVSLLLEDIKEKMKMVNVGALQAVPLTQNKYEELEDVHYLVMKRDSLSISEIDAIVQEIGSILHR